MLQIQQDLHMVLQIYGDMLEYAHQYDTQTLFGLLCHNTQVCTLIYTGYNYFDILY